MWVSRKEAGHRVDRVGVTSAWPHGGRTCEWKGAPERGGRHKKGWNGIIEPMGSYEAESTQYIDGTAHVHMH